MPRLLIIAGPTAVGKTGYSIEKALELGSPVISCDSRQLYEKMTIGTAVPDKEQLASVKHYFIQTIPIDELYTAGRYEVEALALVRKLFAEGHETLVMTGGTGFYIDAVCNGLDDMPDTDTELRASLMKRLDEEGLPSLREHLFSLDPDVSTTIDISNPQRVVRALEVCLLSGKPFSSFKLSRPKEREFKIEKVCLTRPREELYARIDARVDKMMEDGLYDEVLSLMPYRDCPALKTVGYREIFDYIDYAQGRSDESDPHKKIPHSLDEAVSLVKQHTRNYAKRQLTWWRRDPSVKWIEI